jgi:hypothetical protein
MGTISIMDFLLLSISFMTIFCLIWVVIQSFFDDGIY